jgi:hypothetical protein
VFDCRELVGHGGCSKYSTANEFSLRSIGVGRVKGNFQEILCGIHYNRGARRQDGSMPDFGKFAVGGVAFAPVPSA